jgi:hypothetical protein
MFSACIEGFGSDIEGKAFVAQHKVFFARFPNLTKAMEIAFKRKLESEKIHERVIFYLGRLCCEDFMEILLLCGNGHGIGGMKIPRGLYERAVNARFIQRHPDSTQDFIDYYWVSQHKLVQAISQVVGEEVLLTEPYKEVEENFSKVKSKFQITDCKKCGTMRLNQSWNKLDFVSMARQIETLKPLLAPAYYDPTKLIHSTSSAIFLRLENSDDTITFKFGAQHSESDMALRLAHLIILDVLELQRQQFSCESLKEQLDICYDDYHDSWDA